MRWIHFLRGTPSSLFSTLLSSLEAFKEHPRFFAAASQSMGQMCHGSHPQSPSHEHLGCFQSFGITSKTPKNSLVNDFSYFGPM